MSQSYEHDDLIRSLAPSMTEADFQRETERFLQLRKENLPRVEEMNRKKEELRNAAEAKRLSELRAKKESH